MQEVHIPRVNPAALAEIVGPARLAGLLERGAVLRTVMPGRTVVNVNSTAAGGGVAEMLQVLLTYSRGSDIDARWLVIEGDPQFFAITKRLHNHLYGTDGDGDVLAEGEHAHYATVLERNATELAATVQAGDVVILHDPQTAGMAAALKARGATVIWRCHVGTDGRNQYTDIGWEFLRRYLEPPAADAYVFSRAAFAPSWLPSSVVHPIAPSIDPFSPKNYPLDDDTAAAILATAGVIAGPVVHPTFRRADGSHGRVERGCDVVRAGPAPPPDAPKVVQVSRWDRLKDMLGVLDGFAHHLRDREDAQLILAGPVATAVADDPEGAENLAECWEAWRYLPHATRRRVQLVCVPMDDGEENAVIVNALQRHATIVVQKSLAEGFGLTVAEAMYKRRPVIASAVGGIADQVVDGVTGRLLADPADLAAFGTALEELLGDPARAEEMGRRGHERVVEHFLPDTHLRHWAELLLQLA